MMTCEQSSLRHFVMIKGLGILLTPLLLLACGAKERENAPADNVAQAKSPATMTKDERLFANECGICHAAGGTGTIMLTARLGKEQSILSERKDLTEEYIRAVVRNGIGSMPAITRVEVTDEQLTELAAYLTRNNPAGRSEAPTPTSAVNAAE